MALVQALQAACVQKVIDVDGELVHAEDFDVIRPGQLYDTTHPLVRAYPWAFADPERAAAERERTQRITAVDVEQATAAPGERRGTRRRR